MNLFTHVQLLCLGDSSIFVWLYVPLQVKGKFFYIKIKLQFFTGDVIVTFY